MSESPSATDEQETSDDALLAQWLSEVSARLEHGEPIDLEGYDRQDAHTAARLRQLLPTLARLTDIGDPATRADAPGAAFEDVLNVPEGVLGDFRLIREIGRGGMGIVFEAEQISLGRRVALKVLPVAGTMDHRQVQRFQLEAQAAALLQHSGIVPVYSVGWERGVPYYVMQYVDGCSLAEVIRMLRTDGDAIGQTAPFTGPAESTYSGETRSTAEKLGTDMPASVLSTDFEVGPPSDHRSFQLLEGVSIATRDHVRMAAGLGLQAAEALAYAHEQGVVHRDIKPANLLVDMRGNLWVTDFGLARVQAHPNMTAVGTLLGTLRYMSPEQTGTHHAIVDHRTDVYSLGATLYELLTLRPAFSGRDGSALLRQIAELEPRRPRLWNPAIPEDLQTIVLTAMAKEVDRRYVSAAVMAEDLRRFLAGQPILARPVSRRERVIKWARRRPAEAILVGLLVAVVVGTLCFIVQSNVSLRHSNAKLIAATKEAERHEFLARRRAYAYQIKQVNEARAGGDIALAQWVLEGLRAERLGFEWHYLRRVSHRDVSYLFGHQTEASALALAPAHKTLVSGDFEGFLCFWDLANWRLRQRVRGHRSYVQELVLSPDGHRILSRSTGAPNVPSDAKLWDIATGEEIATLSGITGTLEGTPAFSPDGRRAVIIERTTDGPDWVGRALFWDLSAASPLKPVDVWPDCGIVAYAPDGKRLAVKDRSGLVSLRDAATGRERTILGRVPGIVLLTFAPDGRTIAAMHSYGVALWDTVSGRTLEVPPIRGPNDFCFAPSGRRFALARSNHQDASVELGDLAVSPPALRSEPIHGQLLRVGFSPDGKRIAAWGNGLVPTRWDVGRPGAGKRFPFDTPTTNQARFNADGSDLFFSCKTDDKIACWHVDQAPEPVLALRGHETEVWSLAFTLDGRTLASSGDDHSIKLWDVRTGSLKTTLEGHSALVTAIAISPDGRTLASASFDETVRLWDLPDGRLRSVLRGHSDRVRALAFSPDGRHLASGGSDRTVRLWDVGTSRSAGTLEYHQGFVRALAFAPGGKFLMSSGEDRALVVWDFAGRRPLHALECPKHAIALAFSPDGLSLVSGDEAGNLLVWDTPSWSRRDWHKGSGAAIRAVRFSPDGLTLATACDDAKIRLWEATTAQELLALEGHTVRVNAVAFAPDGLTLASASHDGAVKLWRAGPP